MKISIENAKTDGSTLEYGEEEIGCRVITVDDEFKFRVISKDPYGFMTISTGSAGALAKELKGQFTDINAVLSVIKSYVTKKRAEKNKPPRDKNTRKISELLASRNDILDSRDAETAESLSN